MIPSSMTRRKFLTAGAAGVSSLALGMHNLPDFQKNKAEDIRLGVIGTGDRGTGLIHLLHNIEGIKVTACCDILPFRLENGLKVAGPGTKSYKDYRKLLADRNIDAVIIATPFSTHAAIATDAIDAQKHIYCEKTMTKGIAETIALVKKAKQSKHIFQVGHQYHQSRLYLKAVEHIQKGYLGPVSTIECQWNRNGNWRRPVPKPSYERMVNWRMYRAYSGGLVAELCSHQIDFINWAFDAHPLRIMGSGGIDYWKDGRETYDNVHLLMDYPKGIKAKFSCLTTNKFEGYQIKIMGKKGTMVIKMNSVHIYAEDLPATSKDKGLVDGVSGATITAWKKGKGVPLNAVHKNPSIQALQDFKNNINNNTKPISNIHTGAKVALSVQMALDAMYQNRVVNWKPEYDVIL